MSLTYALRRWADPSFESDSEKARMELVLEHAEVDVAVGPGMEKQHRIVIPQRERRCRICNRLGGGDVFCLTCLADTMVADQ